mmetsp:Transcript_9313/g.26592  ORF Transcript_9313/g.26592 Transcript_9313/m.26592 type:complete len:184 (-) Transcript_9313:131-682(-)
MMQTMPSNTLKKNAILLRLLPLLIAIASVYGDEDGGDDTATRCNPKGETRFFVFLWMFIVATILMIVALKAKAEFFESTPIKGLYYCGIAGLTNFTMALLLYFAVWPSCPSSSTTQNGETVACECDEFDNKGSSYALVTLILLSGVYFLVQAVNFRKMVSQQTPAIPAESLGESQQEYQRASN